MKALILAPLALLAGCQHMNYQPPAGDNTAKVTFTSNNTSAQPVVCVPGKRFKATEYALSQNPLGGDALNDLLESMKKNPQVTTTVSAAPATRIGVTYNRRQADNSRTGAAWPCSLIPRPGATTRRTLSMKMASAASH